LFAEVELASSAEASALEVMGLDIEDDDQVDGGLLLQPCGALKGKRCSIYPYRPDCCRTFECRLLQEVRRGQVCVGRAKEQVEEALNWIDRVKELAVQLGQDNEGLPLKERYLEALALSEKVDADPETNRKRDDLEGAMRSVENLIRETFLGG